MRSEQVKKNERIEKDEIYNGEQLCAIQCNTQFQGICSGSATISNSKILVNLTYITYRSTITAYNIHDRTFICGIQRERVKLKLQMNVSPKFSWCFCPCFLLYFGTLDGNVDHLSIQALAIPI